jgi:hypothetical protein
MSLRAECATLLGVSLLSISALGTSVSANDVDLMVLSYPGFGLPPEKWSSLK